MNPNMTYAQMVPGQNGGMGRPYGIIDGYSFVEMLDGVMLLECLRRAARYAPEAGFDEVYRLHVADSAKSSRVGQVTRSGRRSGTATVFSGTPRPT